MSFVGTRPEVTKYVKKYTKEMRARKAGKFYLEIYQRIHCRQSAD